LNNAARDSNQPPALFTGLLSVNTTTTIPVLPDTNSYLHKGSSSIISVRRMIRYIDCRQNEQSQAATGSSDGNKILTIAKEMFSYHKFYYGCYLLQSLRSATEDFLTKVEMNTIVMTIVSASEGKQRTTF